MMRRLENEIRETDRNIDNTRNTMNETQSRIRALEEPVNLCATRSSWRKQRAVKEHIDDPVSTRLEEHKLSLIKTGEELKEHHREEKAHNLQLEEHREKLSTDLQDKATALNIDMNCLKLGARSAPTWAGKALKQPLRTTKISPMNGSSTLPIVYGRYALR